MQIKQIDIYGYGKWVDQSFDLNEGLQIFLGNNEAGKSTLMSFIHSILFGFPTRNSTFLRYEPQESSKYGGRIIAEDQVFGELIIERVHGKVTGDVTVTLEDGATGSDELLEKILKGLSRESFQNIFSFSLSDIENVHQLDKNKLSRYLLNIGAHSTDYYLDLVDDFQKKAYDLYRPSGRIPPLNKELTEIEKQEKKLEKLERRNQSYLELIEKHDEQSDTLKTYEKKEHTLQTKLKDLQEFKKELHVLREIQSLEKEISEIRLPILKKDGQYLLEEYKKEKNEATNQLNDLRARSELEKETFLNPELIEKYQENKKEIAALERDLPEMVEKTGYLEGINEQLRENEEKLQALRNFLNNHQHEALPIFFNDKEKEQVIYWQTLWSQLESEISFLISEVQDLEYKLNLKNQKADQYEELMWDNHYLKDIENQIQRSEGVGRVKKESKSQLLPVTIGIVGLVLILASLLTSSSIQWATSGLGLLLLIWSFTSYQKRSKTKETDSTDVHMTDKLLVNEYKKQLKIKSDWQVLLGEIDGIQELYQEKNEEKSRLLKEQDLLIENWSKLLISHNLPTTHSFERAEEVMEQVNQLNELAGYRKELNLSKEKLTSELESQVSLMNDIMSFKKEVSLNEKINHFRTYLKELNQLLQSEQAKIEQLNAIKEKETQLMTTKETIKNKISHLLEASGAQTEQEFLELYHKKEKQDQKKNRVQFLRENAPAFDSNKELPSKDELFKQEEKLASQLNKIHKKTKHLINERASTQVKIKNLERDGSYSEALQDFENQKASTQHLVDEWISDKIAASIIQLTLNQVTKERFEEIMEKINTYFSFLTDGEYEKVLFKDEELFVQKKDSSVMAVKVLSRGTAEPLYVAIRLAYIVKMQDVTRLPIMIDDPFVNFDQQRKAKVYQLLDQLSDKLQIIYFSFDEELREVFNNNQIIELENY